MSIIEALILGLVQGLTEFIPVSSSGHLVILQDLLNISEGGLAFDVALHFGTLLALIIFFYKDIVMLIRAVFGRTEQSRLAWLLAGATVPAVIVGLLLESAAETTFRSVRLVAINLMAVAVLMLIAERVSAKWNVKTALDKLRVPQALIMGCAQAAAIIPGISRSGSTITAGLFAGLDRVSAMRFSFLLAIPITFGAIMKVMLEDDTLQNVQDESGVFAVGILAAFASGLFAIRFLIRYLSKHTLSVFAWYRLGLGLLMLVVSFLA